VPWEERLVPAQAGGDAFRQLWHTILVLRLIVEAGWAVAIQIELKVVRTYADVVKILMLVGGQVGYTGGHVEKLSVVVWDVGPARFEEVLALRLYWLYASSGIYVDDVPTIRGRDEHLSSILEDLAVPTAGYVTNTCFQLPKNCAGPGDVLDILWAAIFLAYGT